MASFGIPLYAAEGDVLRPYLSVAYSYDDNLRRMHDKNSDSSDLILTTGAGVILSKTISRQTIYADLNFNKTKFDKNSEFDNNGRDLKARWDWEFGNHLKGKLDLGHKVAMMPLSEFSGTTLNVRTYDRRAFDVKWGFHPRWQLRAGLTNYETRFDGIGQQVFNLNENGHELEIDYLTPKGSRTGLVYKKIQGDRPERQAILQGGNTLLIDNSYDQDEYKLNADWPVTGKSQVQFLGGWVKRTHKEFTARDFTGFNARVNLKHMLTGHTKLDLSAWREINAQSFVTSTYLLSKGVNLASDYKATGKTSFKGYLRYEQVDFDGDVLFNTSRTDKLKTASVMVVYQALQSLSINGSLTYLTRDSSVQNIDFSSTAVALTAQYEF